MSAPEDDINRWLEEGLRHYGLGDPAKALDVWLQVLGHDPHNSRAKEYVEIVRSTYSDVVPSTPVVAPSAAPPSAAPPSAAAPSAAAPSVAAPSAAAPSAAPPSVAPPSVAPPSVAPPSAAAPSAAAPTPQPELSTPAATNAAIGPAPASASAPAASAAAHASTADHVSPTVRATASVEMTMPMGTLAAPNLALPDDDSGGLEMPPPSAAPADSIAAPLPITNAERPVDPLDSIEGPSWADVAADAEVASNSFESVSYTTSALYDAKTEVHHQANSVTLMDDDSEASPAATVSSASTESPNGVTSGAAGPVEIEVSDDSQEVSKATSASVSILRNASPIEESATNVVHSVRYGESFDDESPRAGPYFSAIKEKAREESKSAALTRDSFDHTESFEIRRSEILTPAAPLPVGVLPSSRDTVEIHADEVAAAAAADAQAQNALRAPPVERPGRSTLVEAFDENGDATATKELDRAAVAQTTRIPTMSLSIKNDDELAGKADELRSTSGSAEAAAPAETAAAAAPAEEPDIFAPTPLADVPTTPGTDLFAALAAGTKSDASSESSEINSEDSGSDAFRKAWGRSGAPTMDLDVDPTAPSMFDLLLSASDRSNESKPMDVGVLRNRKSAEDGKRGASQDMAPLTSTPAFAMPAQTNPEPLPVDPSDEKHECDVLMDGARELFSLGDFSGSLELVEKVLEIDANHPEAKNYFKQNASTLLKMYESKLGNLQLRPTQLTSPDEVIWMNMHHRAGFVLSQVDGGLTYEEIADVSGLPRLETFRILAELKQNGVIG